MKFFPHRSVQILLTIALIGAISACGQKGKLVQPVRPPAISTPYPTEQPKPEQSDMDSDTKSDTNTTTVTTDSKTDNQ